MVQLVAAMPDHEPALQVKHCVIEDAREIDDHLPALQPIHVWRSNEPTDDDHEPSLQLIHDTTLLDVIVVDQVPA